VPSHGRPSRRTLKISCEKSSTLLLSRQSDQVFDERFYAVGFDDYLGGKE